MRWPVVVLTCVALAVLPACSTVRVGAQVVKDTRKDSGFSGGFKVGQPYQIQGQWYYPEESYTYDETGVASWYGPGFHGKRTANGELYHQGEMTAAHRTLQMPSFVRVTNLTNGKAVVVRVNDRGPFARGRIIDVSEQAALLLGFKGNGTARVRVQVLAEESRQIAQAARQGNSWPTAALGLSTDTGAGRAFQTASLPPPSSPIPPPSPRPYEVNGQPIPAHQISGAYYPDPVVTHQPVPVSTALYIQAGSFSQQANAEGLARRLSSWGAVSVVPLQLNGSAFFRVRLGPLATVAEADRTLARVVSVAPEARIVVN